MFRVDWTPAAVRQLIQIHNEADPVDRPAIRDAARRINEVLRRQADDAGESRIPHFRVVIDAPLAVNCWIGQDEYLDIAAVIHVRRFGRATT